MYMCVCVYVVCMCAVSRGGHSHRHRSHSCDRGQEAVKGSRGQGLFLVSVKRSRTIFKLSNAVKMVAFLWPLTSGTVNS